METVTFTCTVPGDSMRWEPSDASSRIAILAPGELNMPDTNVPGYTVTLTAFNETSLTSTLTRRAENGITVTCVDPQPTLTIIGSSTIQLAGR